VTGYTAGIGIRYRHGFVGFNSFHEDIVLSWDGEQVGGNVVHPVIFPVPCIETFAESRPGLRCFRLVAAGAGDLGFFDIVRFANRGFRVFGYIRLFGMA
jgi:hypothetical protein